MPPYMLAFGHGRFLSAICPHDLVASFKSTLSEVREPIALVHVVDITNHEWGRTIGVVNEVLRDLGAAENTCYHRIQQSVTGCF